MQQETPRKYGQLASIVYLYINNLQVVSKSENTKHAIYCLNKIGKRVLEILEDGTTREYQSIMQAAREKNITDGAIHYALKNKTRCCGHYWQYK